MSWNYRVVKIRQRTPAGHSETHYGIKEVYYNKKGEPDGYTKEFVWPGSDTVEGLREVLVMMLSDSYRPMFRPSDIKKRKKKP